MIPRVLIVHQHVGSDALVSDRDVLEQVAVVEQACRAAGWPVEVCETSLDFTRVDQLLTSGRFDVVFNLVESLAGSDQLAELFVRLVEARGVPITGSSARALQLSNDKIATKQLLREKQLPTAAWCTLDDAGNASAELRPPWIVKAIGQHASLGLDDSCVVLGPAADVAAAIRAQAARLGTPCFAEQFIDGREFNVSLLATEQGVEVLPIAEILFVDFPAGKPRIVGYDAKWSADSAEFTGTPRTFDFPASDGPLLALLEKLSREAWKSLQLSGYARIDFRVDQQAQPLLLEVNTNPCLSPDAGFAAAAAQSGRSLEEAIQQIVLAPLRRSERAAVVAPSQVVASETSASAMLIRTEVTHSDLKNVERIVRATGFFREAEIGVAVELVEERLAKGAASGYEFLFAEIDGAVVGYACYGPISVTEGSYDLYWIAVDPALQKMGVGRKLLARAEEEVRRAGGRRIYIETSGKAEYLPTQKFYERCGYQLEAVLKDFYLPGDDKLVLVRAIA
ncbi:GCN5-related N-acetyltransferase [Pirellula staleyi DSM 6068]|uniref:GCN5-related N-acetyltransferase n=1 Tax=Pirellula staleyi (strain ATCC 27377 / DSM 6068 / ICPB 4128) TaxID=530564 RepID=D2QXW3_PIRSD|nr:GNAT family N-acetyltransferase [Pirellula staleyi]ADB18040.1 GCN5-related N-acetyltransferase [Pirellula staleyi DSM 6068]